MNSVQHTKLYFYKFMLYKYYIIIITVSVSTAHETQIHEAWPHTPYNHKSLVVFLSSELGVFSAASPVFAYEPHELKCKYMHIDNVSSVHSYVQLSAVCLLFSTVKALSRAKLNNQNDRRYIHIYCLLKCTAYFKWPCIQKVSVKSGQV